MTLGSIISNYKKGGNRKRHALYQTDINDIVKRLEGYDKYKKQIKKEKVAQKKRQERRAVKKLKKLLYNKIYTKKPVGNPYLHMYKVARIDPNLLSKYQGNIYSLYEFRHLPLPKSNYTINAGQAWGALEKSFKGFYIAKRNHNPDLMVRYASATQKWAYMLEAPRMPDFPDIGLSSLGFKHSKILKEFFEGFENELTGD